MPKACRVCRRSFVPNYKGKVYCSMACFHKFRHPLEVRFWRRVNKTETCWLWTGATFSNGYGRLTRTDTGEEVLVHRLSWLIHKGKDAGKLCVCHSCDVRLCVNPAHLFLGTRLENQEDMARKLHTRHVLCPDDVRAIRKLKGIVPYRVIGPRFGVTEHTISAIFAGKIWRHVV